MIRIARFQNLLFLYSLLQVYGSDGIPKFTKIMAVNERVQKEKHDFYHVDKAHSRKLSGTGLGLSIVKHTCRNYGIKIDAKSKEGVGSNFILTFPKSS